MQTDYSAGAAPLADQESFSHLVRDDLREVEDLILHQADGYDPSLKAALDLLISAGGKRLRPTLCLLVGHLLGSSHAPLIHISAAVELLHTATLVHDDLIDGSTTRRGAPTLNSRWDPAPTVLAGDFLFASAAKLSTDSGSLPAVALFTQTLRVIVHGEISQFFGRSERIDLEDYFRRIYAKTASLFEAAACLAALLMPIEENAYNSVRKYGQDLGTAFQIMDDLLDIVGDPAKMGKPAGSDLRAGVITLPVILYVQRNPEDPLVRSLVTNGHRDLQSQDVAALVGQIGQSEAIQLSYQRAVELAGSAKRSLDAFPPSEEREALAGLADYVVKRDL
jgi:geranylgeranyl pyrophosphate synthase